MTRCLSVHSILATLAVASLSAGSAAAGGITAETGGAAATWDVVHAEVRAEDRWLSFRLRVAGTIGADKPAAKGEVAGSGVFAYVWPTNLDSGQVGFGPDKGTVALAVTAHPDFDDTPLFDENSDGDLENDGNVWHSHWVVLVPDEACGEGALKVRDIPEGASPKLPVTWPGLPIYIDSPGYSPVMAGSSVEVRVPFSDTLTLKGTAFDAVTAGLRVDESLHAPFLCVPEVFDVASGDLSLPGRVD